MEALTKLDLMPEERLDPGEIEPTLNVVFGAFAEGPRSPAEGRTGGPLSRLNVDLEKAD